VLVCDDPPAPVLSKYGGYATIYHDFLKKGLSPSSSPLDSSLHNVDLQVDVFRVEAKEELPPEEDIPKYQGFMITGSKHGVNDSVNWLSPLFSFIRHVDRLSSSSSPRSPPSFYGPRLVGLCFGHQAIAKALGANILSNHGWEVGLIRIFLNDEGKSIFQKDSLDLNAVHKDHVVDLADSGLSLLGRNDLCAIQATKKGDHILTLQSHPEFTSGMMEGFAEARGQIWGEKIVGEVRSKLQLPTDDVLVSQKILRFFLNEQF